MSEWERCCLVERLKWESKETLMEESLCGWGSSTKQSRRSKSSLWTRTISVARFSFKSVCVCGGLSRSEEGFKGLSRIDKVRYLFNFTSAEGLKRV